MLSAGAFVFVPTQRVVAQDNLTVLSELPEGMSVRSLRKINRARSASSGLRKVCKKVSPIRALWKPAWGGHINSGDPRASGPALVCSRSDCPRVRPANVYYSDGTLAFKVGQYGTWNGNGQPRLYCSAGGAGSCSLRSAAQQARARGRDGKLYVAYGSGQCRSVASPLGRNGSPF